MWLLDEGMWRGRKKKRWKGIWESQEEEKKVKDGVGVGFVVGREKLIFVFQGIRDMMSEVGRVK